MLRLWIVLLSSLMAVGGSFISQRSFGSRTTDQNVSSAALVAPNVPDRAASKADKLDIRPALDSPAKAVIHTIPIAAPVEIVEGKKTTQEKPKKTSVGIGVRAMRA